MEAHDNALQCELSLPAFDGHVKEAPTGGIIGCRLIFLVFFVRVGLGGCCSMV